MSGGDVAAAAAAVGPAHTRLGHKATLDCQLCHLLDAAAAGDDASLRAILAVGAISVDQDLWMPRQILRALRTHWPEWGAEAGVRALHCAAAGGHVSTVRLLLSHRASVDGETRHGMTALCFAAAARHADVTALLLDAGAAAAVVPVDRDGGPGPSALHLACFGDDDAAAECVRRLLQAGARVDAVDSRGQTALHAAAAYGNGRLGNAAACRLLVDAGAWVQAADHAGRTPLRPGVTPMWFARDSRVLCELRWVPAVRQLWLGHSARGGAESPLRQLSRDVVQLICDAALDDHSPPPPIAAGLQTADGEADDELLADFAGLGLERQGATRAREAREPRC